MSFKIIDLINELDGFYPIAGEEGINREVSTVTVMDAPDIYEWMRGKEFLITTGYIMKNDPSELKSLIINLNKNEASGLGIKVGRFISEIPREVIDISNKLKFPLIFIPNKYAFSDVINPILSKIVNSQARKLEISDKIHRVFTKIVVEGKSTEDILEALREILNINIAFLCFYTDKTYLKSHSNNFSKGIKTTSYNKILTNYSHYEVKIGNTLYGYIVIDKDRDYIINDVEQTSIEHAITVLKLDIQKKISNNQVKQRYRDEFINDILMGNISTFEEVKNRGEIYGWVIEGSMFVVVFDVDGFKDKLSKNSNTLELEEEKNTLFTLCKREMKKLFPRVLYTNYSDSMVFLFEGEMGSVKEVFTIKEGIEKLKNSLRKASMFTFSVGIGECESVINLNKSFKQAQEAIKISRCIYGENNNLTYYRELGIYRVLNSIDANSELKTMCLESIQDIKDYDILKGTQYLKTLTALIDNDWELKKTSGVLYIHYNTMKHRFSKLEEIMGLDLKSRNTKFNIEFSIRFLEIKG